MGLLVLFVVLTIWHSTATASSYSIRRGDCSKYLTYSNGQVYGGSCPSHYSGHETFMKCTYEANNIYTDMDTVVNVYESSKIEIYYSDYDDQYHYVTLNDDGCLYIDDTIMQNGTVYGYDQDGDCDPGSYPTYHYCYEYVCTTTQPVHCNPTSSPTLSPTTTSSPTTIQQSHSGQQGSNSGGASNVSPLVDGTGSSGNGGMIAGVICAVIVALLIIGAVIYKFVISKKNQPGDANIKYQNMDNVTAQ